MHADGSPVTPVFVKVVVVLLLGTLTVGALGEAMLDTC